MIIGVGCDIVKISRVDTLMKRYHSLPFLTMKEQFIADGLHSEQRKAEWIAGRFAAKEAVYKAIHKEYACMISDIEILSDEQGAPACKIALYDIQLSIAHEREYAIAYAIASKE